MDSLERSLQRLVCWCLICSPSYRVTLAVADKGERGRARFQEEQFFVLTGLAPPAPKSEVSQAFVATSSIRSPPDPVIVAPHRSSEVDPPYNVLDSLVQVTLTGYQAGQMGRFDDLCPQDRADCN